MAIHEKSQVASSEFENPINCPPLRRPDMSSFSAPGLAALVCHCGVDVSGMGVPVVCQAVGCACMKRTRSVDSMMYCITIT